jgi:hypothetical protein
VTADAIAVKEAALLQAVPSSPSPPVAAIAASTAAAAAATAAITGDDSSSLAARISAAAAAQLLAARAAEVGLWTPVDDACVGAEAKVAVLERHMSALAGGDAGGTSALHVRLDAVLTELKSTQAALAAEMAAASETARAAVAAADEAAASEAYRRYHGRIATAHRLGELHAATQRLRGRLSME